MSSSVNGAIATRSVQDPQSSSKSKKRKHEGKDSRDSSKKRRHEEAQPGVAVEAVPQEVTEISSEKKGKKKQSKKHAHVAAEQAIGNGRDTDALENGETASAQGPSSPHDPEPETTSTTKTKKKKKQKTKDAADEELSADAKNSATTVADADNDIDLPDAPPPETSTTMLPSTSDTQIADLLSSSEPSSFHSTRISLLLSIPAVAISQQHALSSLLATHLSPLLLTYFPPARGIVLAFSNPILSAEAAHALNEPLHPPPASAIKADSENGDPTLTPKAVDATGSLTSPSTLALASDEFGACWAWLTITLLVFRPLPGDELTGWTNVVSEGFVGVVGYNYFQAAIGQTRIPKGWKWMGATGQTSQYGQQQQRKRGRKGRLGDDWHSSQNQENDEDETAMGGPVFGQRGGDEMGYFVDEKGDRVPEVLTFRVVDTEMVPAHEAGGLSLQIDATLLDKQAEEALILEEKQKFERQQGRGAENGEVVMSGALASSRQGSVVPSAALST